jgi:hypothetical protein
MKFSHYHPTATGYRVFFLKPILWGLFKYEKSYLVNKKITSVEGTHNLSENIFVLDEAGKNIK